MRYKILSLSLLLLLAGAQSAWAADRSRYRVEIIVLNHLQHDAVADEVTRPQDYSAALDFLTPAALDGDESGAEAGDTDGAGAGTEANAGESGPAAGGEPAGDSVPEGDPWQTVQQVPELGPEMAEAWRRLRLSGPFRPLQFLAWEQGGDAPIPALRLHDLEVVHREDPWAQLRNPPELAVEMDQPLPPPVAFYRLDGSASLTRGRFLRLALSLELREPVAAEASSPAALPPLAAGGAQPAAQAFRIHRLEQARSVRTGRMEYFDGPVLGVLAWITDISDRFAEELAATAQEQP